MIKDAFHSWILFIIFSGLLLISGITHAWNMFEFPYWENDEGIYMSQAWSVYKNQSLSPYTYWYDHAPAGWMTIAGWIMVHGGVFTYGSALDSGRMMMLGVHLISTGLIFFIAKRISGKTAPAILAVLVFSLSPLAIYFQRRILLDNLLIMWVLLALGLLYRKKQTLWVAMLSALFLGVGILTKEVGVFFIPGFIYLIWQRFARQRLLALVLWITVLGLMGSSYLLFAAVKGELFESGTSNQSQVSLIGSIKEQANRGVDAPFWDSQSMFYDNWIRWQEKDRVLVWGGAAILLLSAGLFITDKKTRGVVLLAWGFAAFLLRTKLLIDFYILPLIPFLGLLYGLIIHRLLERIRPYSLRAVATLGAILITVMGFAVNNIGQYTKNETVNQRTAVSYMKQNISSDAKIAAESAVYLDLKLARKPGEKTFPNVEWAWKIEKDPAIGERKLGNDWRNIDYVLAGHEIMKQIRLFDTHFLKAAVDNADQVKRWDIQSSSFLDLPKYISTNGDWMALYKIKSRNRLVLDTSWSYYKEHFIQTYGQVVDLQTGDTTSEGQAYAMIRAVLMQDRSTFDGVWKWTQDHMQYRQKDKLLSWLWQNNTLADTASASDADLDAAMALVMAGKQWNEPQYITDAQTLIADIWRKEVKLVQNKYILIAGSDAESGDYWVINPSYFSPAAYRMFAEIDPKTPWKLLADDSYYWLQNFALYSKTGLVSNWTLVQKASGRIRSAQNIYGVNADFYGFDAFRTQIRVAWDALWWNTPDAFAWLNNSSRFFENELKTRGEIKAIYDLAGEPQSNYTSRSTLVGALATLIVTDPMRATEIYREFYDKPTLESLDGYWGDPSNYYEQNWSWLGVALYQKLYKPFIEF